MLRSCKTGECEKLLRDFVKSIPVVWFFVAMVLCLALVVPQVRGEAVQVRILGPNSLFTSQDSAAISFELNNILASATGYAGSSATTTVLGGRSLTEAYYHPFHRVATRVCRGFRITRNSFVSTSSRTDF